MRRALLCLVCVSLRFVVLVLFDGRALFEPIGFRIKEGFGVKVRGEGSHHVVCCALNSHFNVTVLSLPNFPSFPFSFHYFCSLFCYFLLSSSLLLIPFCCHFRFSPCPSPPPPPDNPNMTLCLSLNACITCLSK